MSKTKRRVLIADESISIQKMAQLAFADLDFEVIAATDGQDALAKIKKIRPVIVVAASELTEIDGIKLCEVIKKDPDLRGTSVLILKGPMASESRLQKARPDGILLKPFDSKHLIKAVHQILTEKDDEETTVKKEIPDNTVTLRVLVDDNEPTVKKTPKDLNRKLESAAAEVKHEKEREIPSVADVAISQGGKDVHEEDTNKVHPSKFDYPVNNGPAMPAPKITIDEAKLAKMAEQLLKEWIDKNLPHMIEKLLKEEVARMLQSH